MDETAPGPELYARVILSVTLNQAINIEGQIPGLDALEGILLRALAFVQRQQLLQAIKTPQVEIAQPPRPTILRPFPGGKS
jgi:hypothetical protein